MKLTFCLLLAIANCGYSQTREDLLEDIDMRTILLPEDEKLEPWNDKGYFVQYYAKYKIAELCRKIKENKSTSIHIYYKGQLEAYQDVIEYIETH